MRGLITDIRVGSDDIIRITIEGSLRPKVCFRQWFKPALGGEMRPGKAGLSIPLRAAAVEEVHAMPRQGVSSSFRFGQATGEVIGVLKGRRIPLHRPTPQRWKRRFDLIGTDKEAGRQRAIQLWPARAALFARKLDIDRAEAALIAAFAAEAYFALGMCAP